VHRRSLSPWRRVPLPDFHILSLEGPDPYSRAGGIASRVTGLARSLAAAGASTHLWFVGDPNRPHREVRECVELRRWCQWISAHHPGGVYDGEEGKRCDLGSSLPPYLVQEALLPRLADPRRRAVILAEEWQTVDAVLHLDHLLREAGVRERVEILWNANNTYGLDRVDWPRLKRAARITTVSRFMRERMHRWNVDPLVIPNGIPEEGFQEPPPELLREFRRKTVGRLVLGKVARMVPEKRWILAVDTVHALKEAGRRPLLVARGGGEGHGWEVLERAAAWGLRTVHRSGGEGDPAGLLEALRDTGDADLVMVDRPLAPAACRLLYRGADAVLANSRYEPFGLVGLEAMAVGGVACVGGTGEDFAHPGWNSLALQTEDPQEFLAVFHPLQDPERSEEIRRRAREAAAWYRWDAVLERQLLPHVVRLSVPMEPPSLDRGGWRGAAHPPFPREESREGGVGAAAG